MTTITTETGSFTCRFCGADITRDPDENGWRDLDRGPCCPDGGEHSPAVETDPNGEPMTMTDDRARRLAVALSVLAAELDPDEGAAPQWGARQIAMKIRAAVKESLTVAETQAPSLGQRVTSVLRDAGYRDRREPNPERFPAFAVSDADAGGVMVGTWWVNAGDDWREKLLGKYAEALQADGLKIDVRVGYLYVHDPSKTEAAPAAGTENDR